MERYIISSSRLAREVFGFLTCADFASSAARSKFNFKRRSRICSSVRSAGKP